MSLSRTVSASSSRTASSSASSSTSTLSQTTDSDPASAFCKNNRAFGEWLSSMDSVVVEVPFKPKPNALKATELTANLHSGLHFESRLGDLINRDFVEGLFLIHNQRHYSETSFRTVIDALFKSAFTNDVYQAIVEARMFLPGGNHVVPPLATDVDLVAIRTIISPTQIFERRDLQPATLFDKCTVDYKQFSIAVCFVEYSMCDSDHLQNKVILDLIANARQLSYLGIWDVEVHAIALLHKQPIKLYAAQIDTTGSIKIVSSAEPIGMHIETLEGFISLFHLFCRIRDYSEQHLVRKCQALNLEHMNTARHQFNWRPRSVGRLDEDGRDVGMNNGNDGGGDVRRKRGRSSSSSVSESKSNKERRRNGGGGGGGGAGYGDGDRIIAPSPRHFLNRKQTILSPGFLDNAT